MSDRGGPEYAMVMPFVVCASQGGPFHDDAFVAGCEFATVQTELGALPVSARCYERIVRRSLLPQYDLLAMHLGFKLDIWSLADDGALLEASEQNEGEWIAVAFERVIVGLDDTLESDDD